MIAASQIPGHVRRGAGAGARREAAAPDAGAVNAQSRFWVLSRCLSVAGEILAKISGESELLWTMCGQSFGQCMHISRI